MSAEVAGAGPAQPQYTGRKAFLWSALISFVFIAIAACFLCAARVENETQTILNRQRDHQQTMLDKTLDAISVWRLELEKQAKFISGSEMFRVFISDTRGFSQQRLEELSDPESLHSDDETTRSLAEQRAYMQDLLKDFTRRRAWNEARIISVEGNELLASDAAPPLTDAQKELVEKASGAKRATFGPIRQSKGELFMDMADPFFEILGADEPRIVGVLLLTVPMDKPLSAFLANPGGQNEPTYARIVDQSGTPPSLIMLRGNKLTLRHLAERVSDGPLPFELRPALASLETISSQLVSNADAAVSQPEEVYSLGAEPALLNWLYVLETPASWINEEIRSLQYHIYGLGAVGTLFLACAVAFFYARNQGRKHKAHAEQLAKLNHQIRQQKLILDGVNKSLDAGLLLVDDKGDIHMANPAFHKMAGRADEDLEGVPLVDVLPAKVSVDLIGRMRNVIAKNEPDTAEISLPEDGRERLYRVSLLPYEAVKGESSSSGSGCVATFKDITVFRANARKAQQRQEALLTAMDRALESVDPHLVGQSAKMAAVSRLLGEELGLDASEKETLRIASLLSQIGKLFVPRQLLLKRGKLTPDEKMEVARAPEHADRILSDLSFDLPVRETVFEMGERLDGSGPGGYTGSRISGAGRVLAVVNAFIAMTSPRAWRASSGMKPEEAINTLAGDQRFDQSVIEALRKLDPGELGKAVQG